MTKKEKEISNLEDQVDTLEDENVDLQNDIQQLTP